MQDGSRGERPERSGRIWRGITVPLGKSQVFELRLYDEVLACFEAHVDRFGVRTFALDTQSITDWRKLPIPLASAPTNEALVEWLRTRTVPRHQKYAKAILKSAGIDPDDLLGQLGMSLGLSLSDAHWIVPAGLDLRWDEINLFHNDNLDVLSLAAYTGEVVNTSERSLLSTSWGTSGSFAKAWRREPDGTMVLYKSGSELGAANDGQEPWSEYVAAQVAEACGIAHVPYRLDIWKGRLCSTCPQLNDDQTALSPSYLCAGTGGLYTLLARYAVLGPQALEDFRDMVTFDALIANTDRHGANYAFLRDNHTGIVTALAPLYDHNLSLFSRDMPSDYPAWRDGSRVRTDELCRPSGHEMTFDQQAMVVMGERQRTMVARVAGIELHNAEGAAAVPSERLEAWQRYLRVRARQLLALPETSADELAELIASAGVTEKDVPICAQGLVAEGLGRSDQLP